MTKREHSPERTGDGLFDLIFVVAAIVLIFNLSVLMALFLLQATAPPPDTVAEFQFRGLEASEIQKKLTTTTPKEDRESVRITPGALNRSWADGLTRSAVAAPVARAKAARALRQVEGRREKAVPDRGAWGWDLPVTADR